MPYATESDFEGLIGSQETLALCDQDNDGVADVGRLALALAAATADIDGLLLARRTQILADYPELLRNACIHFARWHLSGGSVTETDPVKERHDYYTKLLRDLADGVSGNDTAATAAHGGEAIMTSAGRLFGRGTRGL